MAARVRGHPLSSLRRTSGGTITYKEDGSVEGREKFYCLWNLVPTLAPKRNQTKHPDFSTLTCSTSAATRMKGGVAEITSTYVGFFADPNSGGGEPVSQENWVQELMASTQSAPIDTHPNFVSTLGGTKDSPLNDAIFDVDGIFQGFAATSQFRGIKSFLIPSVTYRLRRANGSAGSLANLGKIDAPSVSIAGIGAKNWLLTTRSWRRQGSAFELSEEWLLSGVDGWKPEIYT